MPTVPAPIQVKPSGNYEGLDGPWSTFTLDVGRPAQEVNVLPSNLLSETWVVADRACTSKSPFTDCAALRGGTFDNTSSSTWDVFQNGDAFSLGKESNLLNDDVRAGMYGYDSVAITTAQGSGVGQDDQLISQILPDAFWLGSLGLNPKTAGIEGQTKPSFLKSLSDDKKIPSLSWSYTAGAVSRKQEASLTLGGQDTSRFESNNVNFTLSSDSVRDLTVGIQSITLQDGDEKTSLLSTGMKSFIDTTLPNIWIPTKDCDAWKDAFGLRYDATTLMYQVNATQRKKNLDSDAKITFTIGQETEGGDTVDIVFPYAAFDLNYTNPGVTNPKELYYFPLRQAGDTDQYVLGRAFLQNAYLSVNYEYRNFSLSQAVTGDTGDSHTIPLPAWSESGDRPADPASPSDPASTEVTVVDKPSSGGGGGGFPKAAIAGIVIPILLIIGVAFFFWRRRRNNRGGKSDVQAEKAPQGPNIPELVGHNQQPPAYHHSKSVPIAGQGTDYFSSNPPPHKSQARSTANELESPQPPAGFTPLATPDGHHNMPGQSYIELSGDPVASELHSHRTSITTPPIASATLSQGPSPNLTPAAQPWSDHSAAAFDPTSPRPSVASTVPYQQLTDRARIVSHSRGGSSPHGSGLAPFGMSPTALTPQDPNDPHNEAHDEPSPHELHATHSNEHHRSASSSSAAAGGGLAAAAGSSAAHASDAAAHNRLSNNTTTATNPHGLSRGGSHRSQASEGTLVNAPTEGGPSPMMRGIGEEGDEDVDGRTDGGRSAVVSPILPGGEFAVAGTRGMREAAERERMVSPEPLEMPQRRH